ncbi:hypothetical protein [Paenibacillus dakarensis]|uniref:hypothetical protein n=1 Tax=Paenibacillus dakarensis TaxID=1527293 RepID=UPI0006D58C89|nr:hypothetical protein [Paenibacillus dakarensis]
MKQTPKIIAASAILGCTLIAGAFLNPSADGAGTAQPGTTDDPVVTKSYVDQQIQQALGGGTTQPGNPGTTTEDEIKVVTLKPGKILIADAGAEFIVRSGKAIIYTQDSNGVADLTDGKDLLNGQAAPLNHLLSFPRDGRGIKVKDGVTSNLIVMVRGGYTIQ